MDASPEHDVTRLLGALRDGDTNASDRLHSLIYDELRRLAASHMHRQAVGHTLQTTALVNEAWIRMVGGDDRSWENRAKFMSFASMAMRSVLVDHARSGAARKRGGDRDRVPLGDIAIAPTEDPEAILALHDALTRLAAFDERRATIVELRFFGGLDLEEAARVLDVSPTTLKREWRLAKAWLRREIELANDDEA